MSFSLVSLSTTSTQKPTYTVTADPEVFVNLILPVAFLSSDGSRGGTVEVVPNCVSLVEMVASVDQNSLRVVDDETPVPLFTSVSLIVKVVPDETVTFLGEIPLNLRLGEPEEEIVTWTDGEQLLLVSDSPATGSRHAPT